MSYELGIENYQMEIEITDQTQTVILNS